MRYRYAVTVTTEEQVDPVELSDYILDAVASWGGQFDPDDPLFPSNIKRVDARRGNMHRFTTND